MDLFWCHVEPFEDHFDVIGEASGPKNQRIISFCMFFRFWWFLWFRSSRSPSGRHLGSSQPDFHPKSAQNCPRSCPNMCSNIWWNSCKEILKMLPKLTISAPVLGPNSWTGKNTHAPKSCLGGVTRGRLSLLEALQSSKKQTLPYKKPQKTNSCF